MATYTSEEEAEVTSAFQALVWMQERGARFVPLKSDGSKVLAGASCTCGVKPAPSGNHAASCQSPYALGLTEGHARSLLEEHTRQSPRIGLVPSTAGLFVVDVDGADGKKARDDELAVAVFAWSQHFRADPEAVTLTQGKGYHLVYRTGKLTPPKQAAWSLKAVVSKGEDPVVIAQGDIRYDAGYGVAYDIHALAKAMSAREPEHTPSFVNDDLYRTQRAAALLSAKVEGKHEYAMRAMTADYRDGAIISNGWWLKAFEMVRPGRDDVERGWKDVLKQADAEGFEPPPLGDWRRNSGRRRAAREDRRDAIAESCSFPHDADPVGDADVAWGLASDKLTHFDGQLHIRDGQTHYPARRDDVTALLHDDLNACWNHATRMTSIIMARALRAGRNAISPNYRTVLVDGKVFVITPRSVATERRRGRPPEFVEDLMFEAMPGDMVVATPEFDIGPKPDDIRQIATIISEFGAVAGIREEEMLVMQQYLGTALGDSLKDVLVILAEPDTGKSIIPTALSMAFGQDCVYATGGASVDIYASGRMLRAGFVIAEEAQDIKGAGWAAMKNKTGGNTDTDRMMGVSGRTIPSRASFVMIAERRRMNFKPKGFDFKGGWLKRFVPIVGESHPDSDGMPWRTRERLLTPQNIRELAWSLLMQPITPRSHRTKHIQHALNAIAVASEFGGVLDFQSDGRLVVNPRKGAES